MVVRTVSEDREGPRAIGAILARVPQPVGTFAFWFQDRRWEWSNAAADMYGYPPEVREPTTELLMRHLHHDDRPRAGGCANQILRGEPFSSRHRVVDTAGRRHVVVVAGAGVFDDNGVVIGVRGFCVDVTLAVESDIDAMVAGWAESRAQIEQAKGVLMAAYGVDAQRAFEVLVWRSKSQNIKLRELARRFLTAIEGTNCKNNPDYIDHALLFAHSAAPISPDTTTGATQMAREDQF